MLAKRFEQVPHLLLGLLLSILTANTLAQYFDPKMDDKTYLDKIQTAIKEEVNETKTELIIQAKIVDDAAKRFVAAQIKENLFIALRVLAERELRDLDRYSNTNKQDLATTIVKKPRQEEGGGGGGGDDDDDGEDATGATTGRPNNIIPQVANLVKAVFGGNGNINLTSYVESASKLLPRPIGNQVLGFVKLLAHNPKEGWTTTPSTKEQTVAVTTQPTTTVATTPQAPFIVVLPASVASGSDNGAAAISQALSETAPPTNSNNAQNSINSAHSNGTSLFNAQANIANFETSSPSSNVQYLQNINSQQAQLQTLQQNQIFAQIQQQQQLGNIQTSGISGNSLPETVSANVINAPNPAGVPATGPTVSPIAGIPLVEEDDDDDDDEQEARQLNSGLQFLGVLIGGVRTTRRSVDTNRTPALPPTASNSTTTGNSSMTAAMDNGEIDLRGVAESVRNGLGDLIRVMPDLFKGAREGFRLMQTISQVFGGLGGVADIAGE